MRRPVRHVLATLLALCLALTAVACGDDPDDTSSPSSTAAASDGDTTTPSSTGDATEPADTPTEVVVSHAQGETTVPYQPETVVVFDLGVLVTLDELGIEVAGVPELAALDAAMPQYADVERVGTLFEPDFELVNSMEPDLVIVAGRSGPAYEELSKIAPTIDLTVDNADFFGSFRERTEALATIWGVEDEVATALDDIDESIVHINELAADAGSALIVLTSGGEVTAYGPGSRFGLIHDDLGVTPAVEDIEEATHGNAISFEFILEATPDILYVVDRDAATNEPGPAASAVLDNEIVHRTPAWQNDKVVYLDPFAWYLAPGGIGSVRNMLDTIESSLS